MSVDLKSFLICAEVWSLEVLGGGAWGMGAPVWKDPLEEVGFQLGLKRRTLLIQAASQHVTARLGIALCPGRPGPVSILLSPQYALQWSERPANITGVPEPSLGLWAWWQPPSLESWAERLFWTFSF